MKIIITGATGFMGRNLAQGLHGDGHQVLATGRSAQVGRELAASGIEFQAADIEDRSRLEEVFAPADCVVHCAARAGDWGRADDFHRTNVVGTRHVAAACAQCGIEKLVFVSSPSIYYDGSDRFGIAEDAPLPSRQTTHYAKSKRIGERELLEQQGRGPKVIVLRPRAVFGPHDRIIAPRILRLAAKTRFPLIEGGKARVDITYVDNFTQAVRRCLAADESAWGEIYNISNGEPIAIRDWFEKLLGLFGKPFRPKTIPFRVAHAVGWAMELASRLPLGPERPTLTRFSVGYMARSMTLSIDKAKARLGYTPIGNAECYERYAAWIRAHPSFYER